MSGPLCDGGSGSDGTSVTGTISGTVTIAVVGAGIANVTVALSNGSTTTTGGNGAYAFSGVPAGSYTVTISNAPANVTCSGTSRSVTISNAARQATAHFTCEPVAGASISGTVSAEGFSAPHIEVTLSGPSEAVTTTDGNGEYSFTSLTEGVYTVTIGGFFDGLYAFATTSRTVTLSAGEAATADFEGFTCFVGSIALDQTREGTLAAGTARTCIIESGEFVEAWSFSLGSSTAVQINLSSSQFDALVFVTDLTGLVLASDDDSGGGTNSQINVTLEAGNYVIWAASFFAGEGGAYQLSVR